MGLMGYPSIDSGIHHTCETMNARERSSGGEIVQKGGEVVRRPASSAHLQLRCCFHS